VKNRFIPKLMAGFGLFRNSLILEGLYCQNVQLLDISATVTLCYMYISIAWQLFTIHVGY